MPLSSGDWVTQDRAAWFTYRNPGPGSAVVSMAALVARLTKSAAEGAEARGSALERCVESLRAIRRFYAHQGILSSVGLLGWSPVDSRFW